MQMHSEGYPKVPDRCGHCHSVVHAGGLGAHMDRTSPCDRHVCFWVVYVIVIVHNPDCSDANVGVAVMIHDVSYPVWGQIGCYEYWFRFPVVAEQWVPSYRRYNIHSAVSPV